MARELEQIIQTLRKENNFFVASHLNPDGDAIGSLVGMGYILKALGKEFRLFCEGGMPERFLWLNSPAPIESQAPAHWNSWAIVLDCGEKNRLGETIGSALDPSRTVVIDHHVSNPGFGIINWVDPAKSSVGDMVAMIADAFEIPITGDLARALYLAIASDTGFFTYGNTRPETLEIVARMIRNGLNPGPLNAAIQNHWSMNRLHLQGFVLRHAKLLLDGRVGLLTVPADLLNKTKTTSVDCEGLVNLVGRVKGVRIAALLRDDKPGRVKFSLRSVGQTDVQVIAQKFGGGGHKNAAGGSLSTTLEEAETILVSAIQAYLESA